jgi:hypothetical protein
MAEMLFSLKEVDVLKSEVETCMFFHAQLWLDLALIGLS